MGHKFLWTIIIAALGTISASAQTPGQMKVVKPLPIDTFCNATVIDTIDWKGEKYYVLNKYFYKYQWAEPYCDANFPTGKFAIYGVESGNDDLFTEPARIRQTMELKNYELVRVTLYDPNGELVSDQVQGDSAVLEDLFPKR